ncbi:hypothetical protein BN1013_01736 [Candidatus Rubidus massiliensis]|nr:MAG: hypothetical protein BGO10_09135 [Chlamydia sp. 32-24]CDZ81205.1 hypothetical protein BN1013_01736 [Candidatus Rubidus massiliensis]
MISDFNNRCSNLSEWTLDEVEQKKLQEKELQEQTQVEQIQAKEQFVIDKQSQILAEQIMKKPTYKVRVEAWDHYLKQSQKEKNANKLLEMHAQEKVVHEEFFF